MLKKKKSNQPAKQNQFLRHYTECDRTLWEIVLALNPGVGSPTFIQIRRLESGKKIWKISIVIPILIQSS